MSEHHHHHLERVLQRSETVRDALAFAEVAHAGQMRKGSDIAYVVHLKDAANILASVCQDETAIAATVLHDTREDTLTTAEHLADRFGRGVAGYVDEVTDRFTKDLFPGMNRAARKQREAERLSQISDTGKLIKLADIASNVRSETSLDPAFAELYAREKDDLLPRLIVPDSPAHEQLVALIRNPALQLPDLEDSVPDL